MAWGVIRLAICALVVLGVSLPLVAAVAKAEIAIEQAGEREQLTAEATVQQAEVRQVVKEPCCKHLHGTSIFCFGDATPAAFETRSAALLVGSPPWPSEQSHLKTGEPAPMLRPPIS